MIYLLTGILASTSIFVIFRWIQLHGAFARHAILINYLVAALVGMVIFQPGPAVFLAPWFLPTAIEGVFFYLTMLLIARTTEVSGVAIVSIATKMSVIIPVFTGIVLLHESVTATKLTGVATGLVAVFLASRGRANSKNWLLPLLAFLATGTIDASFKLFQAWTVSSPEFPAFITTIYAFAFFTGCLHQVRSVARPLLRSSICSGTLLGLANFATVFCIMTVLALPEWESSVVLPVNNFGIVVLSTLVGVLVFRESLSPAGWLGMGLAVVSISLLALH